MEPDLMLHTILRSLWEKAAGKFLPTTFPNILKQAGKGLPLGEFTPFSRHFPTRESCGHTTIFLFPAAPFKGAGKGNRKMVVYGRTAETLFFGNTPDRPDRPLPDLIYPGHTPPDQPHPINTTTLMKTTLTKMPYWTPAGIVMDEPPPACAAVIATTQS